MEELTRCGRYDVPILLCDNQVLAVVKPRNMPVQADASGDPDLLSAMKRYVGRRYNKPGAVYLGLVHRLDRPVGGVMVFARTSKAAQRLTAAFAGHDTVEKQYLAVLQGALEQPRTLTDWLIKDPATGMVRVVPEGTPGAKQAILDTRPLARRDGTTLTEVTLHTGRAHQIRVQHLAAGHPLWGDARYGGGRPGQQIALWAWRLSLPHPTNQTRLTFRALPPMDGAWTAYRDILEDMNP